MGDRMYRGQFVQQATIGLGLAAAGGSLAWWAFAPAGLSAEERNTWDQLDFFYKHALGYAIETATAHKYCTRLRIRPSV